MRSIAIIGAGAGGAAAVVELTLAGHEVRLWNRSAHTLAPFQTLGGVAYDGVFGEGVARPRLITADLGEAIAGADVILVCLPTFAHAAVARALAEIGATTLPVVLNPGHTGGALEFRQAFRGVRPDVPPIAEFSTLTYVARKYAPERVTISGAVKKIRLAALPGGQAAALAGGELYPAATVMPDVLACDLANVNMVLHPPGAVLAAAWVEATGGDFTFYVDAMTPGVGRVMQALDDERRAVARAFGHELPPLIEEMQALGTVEASVRDMTDLVGAISSGHANQRIKAPNSFQHRYYREDFGHGLLPFLALAGAAQVAVPVADSLFKLGETLTGNDYKERGRTAARMGIAGLDRQGVMNAVKGNAGER
jgi:opine dehydrogenase